MKEFLATMEKCPLFEGIDQGELAALLDCLGAQIKSADKSTYILNDGERAENVGIVLTGAVQIIREDYYGRRSVLAQAGAGALFAESFACADAPLSVSVVASENCKYMLINCRRIIQGCSAACSFHSKMSMNLLKVVAEKNLFLNQKLEIISRRTTHEKLMAYLMAQAKLHGSNSFTIPFDRQALADFLGVERSAMSAEISKLRSDGIIESERSYFKLL